MLSPTSHALTPRSTYFTFTPLPVQAIHPQAMLSASNQHILYLHYSPSEPYAPKSGFHSQAIFSIQIHNQAMLLLPSHVLTPELPQSHAITPEPCSHPQANILYIYSAFRPSHTLPSHAISPSHTPQAMQLVRAIPSKSRCEIRSIYEVKTENLLLRLL